MASRASIGGHPIHPMLIPFPIALLVFSLIADLIYLWQGNPIWESYLAFYTLLGGLIGGAAAAIPGLIDWATLTDRDAVRVANWHARVNIITLAIFAASFYLRTSGGELVFKHRVAVSESAGAVPEKPEAQRHIRAA